MECVETVPHFQREPSFEQCFETWGKRAGCFFQRHHDGGEFKEGYIYNVMCTFTMCIFWHVGSADRAFAAVSQLILDIPASLSSSLLARSESSSSLRSKTLLSNLLELSSVAAPSLARVHMELTDYSFREGAAASPSLSSVIFIDVESARNVRCHYKTIIDHGFARLSAAVLTTPLPETECAGSPMRCGNTFLLKITCTPRDVVEFGEGNKTSYSQHLR